MKKRRGHVDPEVAWLQDRGTRFGIGMALHLAHLADGEVDDLAGFFTREAKRVFDLGKAHLWPILHKVGEMAREEHEHRCRKKRLL